MNETTETKPTTDAADRLDGVVMRKWLDILPAYDDEAWRDLMLDMLQYIAYTYYQVKANSNGDIAMVKTVFTHDGGNITAKFEIKETEGSFFIYRSGTYWGDAKTLEDAIAKLKNILYRCGLNPITTEAA